MSKIDISDFTDFLYECLEIIYAPDINLIYDKTKVLNNYYCMVETFDTSINNLWCDNNLENNLWYNLYLHNEKLFIKTFLNDIYSYNWLHGKYINHHIICNLSINVQKVFLWSIQRNNCSDELKLSSFPITYIETFDEFVELINVLLDILTDKDQDLSMFDNTIYESVTIDMNNEIDRIRVIEDEKIALIKMEDEEKTSLFENDIRQYLKKYHMSKVDMYNEIQYCKDNDLIDRMKVLQEEIEHINGYNYIRSRSEFINIVNEHHELIERSPFF